jgi:hypothetical protein
MEAIAAAEVQNGERPLDLVVILDNRLDGVREEGGNHVFLDGVFLFIGGPVDEDRRPYGELVLHFHACVFVLNLHSKDIIIRKQMV